MARERYKENPSYRERSCKRSREWITDPKNREAVNKSAYRSHLVKAYNMFSKRKILSKEVRTTKDLNQLILTFVQLVKRNPAKAKNIVGLNGLPNYCRLVEGKVGRDVAKPDQFIRAALDEPNSLRYETFPTKKDREAKTNGRLFLSVWDLMRSFFEPRLKNEASERWLRYQGFVETMYKRSSTILDRLREAA
jgi:hypothetical protein